MVMAGATTHSESQQRKGLGWTRSVCLYAALLLLAVIVLVPRAYWVVPRFPFEAYLLIPFGLALAARGRDLWRREDIPLWLFAVTVAICITASPSTVKAVRLYLGVVIPLVTLYYIVPQALTAPTAWRILPAVVAVASGLVSVWGLLEMVFRYDPLYDKLLTSPFYEGYISSRLVRPMASQYHPAPLGTMLLGCLPFNLILWRENRGRLRLLGAVAALLSATVILFAFSRGVFLAALAATSLFLCLQGRFKVILILVAVVAVVVSICSFLPYPYGKYGWRRLTTGHAGALSAYRYDRILMTVRIAREHPWTGIGYKQVYPRFYDFYPRDRKESPYLLILDNMYLTLVAETGLISTSAFLLFLLGTAMKARRSLQRWVEDPRVRFRLVLVLCGWFGILVNMAAYELFYWRNPYALLCFLWGCIEYFERLGEPATSAGPPELSSPG